MKTNPAALVGAALLITALAIPTRAAQPAPVAATAVAAPKAPPGLSQPLPDGPFIYRTGEGFSIRVSVLARVTSPYGLAFLPDGELLVTTRDGHIHRMPKGTTTLIDVPGGPVSIQPTAAGVHGYMSLAVHPQFASNRWVYLVYAKSVADNKRVNAVSRARFVDGRLQGATDVWVGEFASTGPAAVTMTPDAKLMIALSGGFGKVAQEPGSLAGKVIRLNDDGSIPKDNPFVGKAGVRPEIFTMGHRTALGLAVHPVSGQVFMSEMGPNGGDEVNLLKAGANYGWPLVSLGRAYPGPWQAEANEPTHHGFELPVVYWTPSISVSGLTFYESDAIPQWKGNLLIGGVRYGEIPGTGRIDRVVFNGALEEVRRETLLTDLHQRFRDVKPSPDGLLYLATDEVDGAILRIEPVR